MIYDISYKPPLDPMRGTCWFGFTIKLPAGYTFSYIRDILSDLSKFNTPVFVAVRNRGSLLNGPSEPVYRVNPSDAWHDLQPGTYRSLPDKSWIYDIRSGENSGNGIYMHEDRSGSMNACGIDINSILWGENSKSMDIMPQYNAYFERNSIEIYETIPAVEQRKGIEFYKTMPAGQSHKGTEILKNLFLGRAYPKITGKLGFPAVEKPEYITSTMHEKHAVKYVCTSINKTVPAFSQEKLGDMFNSELPVSAENMHPVDIYRQKLLKKSLYAYKESIVTAVKPGYASGRFKSLPVLQENKHGFKTPVIPADAEPYPYHAFYEKQIDAHKTSEMKALVNKMLPADPMPGKAYRFDILECIKRTAGAYRCDAARAFIQARKKGFLKQPKRPIKSQINRLNKLLQGTSGIRVRPGMMTEDGQAMAAESRHGFSPENEYVPAEAVFKKFNVNNSGIHVRYSFRKAWQEKHADAFRSLYEVQSDDSSLMFSRSLYGAYMRSENISAYRTLYGMSVREAGKHAYRNLYGVSLENARYLCMNGRPIWHKDKDIHASGIRRGISVQEEAVQAYKDRHGISVETEEEWFTVLPHGIDINQGIGFITERHGIMLQELKGAESRMRNAVKDRCQQTAHRNARNAIANSPLWLFKEPDEAWTDTHSYMFTKLAVLSMIQDGIWADKNGKAADTAYLEWLDKNIKHAWAENGMHLNTAEKPAWKSDMQNALKHIKQAWIENNAWIAKRIKTADIYKGMFLWKDRYGIHTSLPLWACSSRKSLETVDSLFTARERYGVEIYNDHIAFTRRTGIDTFPGFSSAFKTSYRVLPDSQPSAVKEKPGVSFPEDPVFVPKSAYEMSIAGSILRMQRLVKDLEKPVEKSYNWAWVYEPENPMGQDEEYRGLDELLLPEKDIDYSQFEDMIFNKDKLRPRNPIEEIDDTTFRAKFPTAHPAPDYEDIGIVYIDVPSELMYKIFCKYYEIWYANIFKFGNMSMVDALRLMLDFMYSWIILSYSGTQYLEPALRVFRQIRWFGERSVMKSAQYIIHYKRADLKCNLKSGYLSEIENTISETNAFYIDPDLGVIAENTACFHKKVSFALKINLKSETELTFNLMQAGGRTVVLLDKKAVLDTIAARTKAEIEIPEGPHTVTIYRPENENFATWRMGNIVLKNAGYADLEITYDPELRLGNMPLNDVAEKMLDLASIYDDEKEAFERYRKGNLAVSELYKELERYWELHHRNKIKGKRLTIKEA